MGNVKDDLSYVLSQQRTPRMAFPGLYEGRVVSVAAEGLMVMIPSYSADWKFGPARWQRPPGAADPPAGTVCLVGFAEEDGAAPWVVAFWAYP